MNAKAVSITSKTSVSIAVVVLFLGVFGSNMTMVFRLSERVTSLDAGVSGIREDIGDIKTALLSLTSTTRDDLRELRSKIQEMEVELAKLKASANK